MRLFGILAAASQATAEIIVPDIIRDALAKSDCASNTLEKCAMRVKQDMEAAITYENWNCIVAAENAGQYSSLKNDGFGYYDASKRLYAQITGSKYSLFSSSQLTAECQKANNACSTTECIADWFNVNYYQNPFCPDGLKLYEALFLKNTSRWSSAWYNGAAAWDEFQCIAYCK
ncbi:Oidioi.mRNA.OKI2018_I69.chr2.g5297.t1.cds [Oikopleura dioica]|uniref:Oidioi.mRNA.OKI2018_I69.chr2.g5297.t1.cds n=1 Tax=Oikopleura dioica TaxID=34765 RepID=A0ABN7SZI0_OIKDI|nr:Oidioi.mRNA.OKI2018_I69.chr2.g5297.t1.cds [Oikopleura dioica]